MLGTAPGSEDTDSEVAGEVFTDAAGSVVEMISLFEEGSHVDGELSPRCRQRYAALSSPNARLHFQFPLQMCDRSR